MQAMVTAITAAVEFDPIIGGIGVIGAAIAIVLVSMKGLRLLLAALR